MWEMLTYSRDWTEACACFLLKETESSKSLMCVTSMLCMSCFEI